MGNIGRGPDGPEVAVHPGNSPFSSNLLTFLTLAASLASLTVAQWCYLNVNEGPTKQVGQSVGGWSVLGS